jgi:hypothetical protein
LREQYIVGFIPTTNGNGQWHKLNVKVNSQLKTGHLYVRSRQGYFANF